MVARLLIVTVALLALASAPAGAAQGETIDEMASLVAGSPVDAQCETDDGRWRDELRLVGLGKHRLVFGYVAWLQRNVIRLGPDTCEMLRSTPGTMSFGAGLYILGHEAAHSRGVFDEGLASCYGLVWAAHLASAFYGIGFFTPGSLAVLEGARRVHSIMGPEYRSACP